MQSPNDRTSLTPGSIMSYQPNGSLTQRNSQRSSPLRLGVLSKPQTISESIDEQWLIRDNLLRKTLKDILTFSINPLLNLT